MIYLLIIIISSILFIYSTRKTKSIFVKDGRVLKINEKKFYYYFFSIYTIIPSIVILFTLNLFGNFFIKYILFSNFHNNVLSPITYEAILQSVHHAILLIKNNVDIINYKRIDFFLTNKQILVLAKKMMFYNTIKLITIFIITLICCLFVLNQIIKKFNTKTNFQKYFERTIEKLLLFCSFITVFITIAILLSLSIEALKFFNKIPFLNFLLGTSWTPENYQFDPYHSFGVIPLITGTLLISIIAIFVALIIALPTAIYMAEFMNPKIKTYVKPILEILAGIPTIVYGFFGSLVFAPLLVKFLKHYNISTSNDSAIIAGIIIGIMIVPFISSLTDDIISSIPKSMKEGGIALGSMHYEVINKILLPIALPGILGGFLLAFSRAIGETMIVVMVSGLVANLTFNPLESVTTITTQIVNLVQGDQEFDSPKTLSLFALGFTLFCITLLLNLISFWVIKKFSKKI